MLSSHLSSMRLIFSHRNSWWIGVTPSAYTEFDGALLDELRDLREREVQRLLDLGGF